MIQVCCAIIVNDHKILAVQRGAKSSHPLKWEFPGGKINPCESAEQCIVRELHEELLIQTEIVLRLKSVEFEYPEKHIELIPFVCEIVSGELTLTEHVASEWFCFDDWQRFDWAEADYKLILKNYETLSQLLV